MVIWVNAPQTSFYKVLLTVMQISRSNYIVRDIRPMQILMLALLLSEFIDYIIIQYFKIKFLILI